MYSSLKQQRIHYVHRLISVLREVSIRSREGGLGEISHNACSFRTTCNTGEHCTNTYCTVRVCLCTRTLDTGEHCTNTYCTVRVCLCTRTLYTGEHCTNIYCTVRVCLCTRTLDTGEHCTNIYCTSLLVYEDTIHRRILY